MRNNQVVAIHPSWYKVLEAEFYKEYFIRLTSDIKQEIKEGKTIYPPGNKIFEAFELTPFDKVKAVIIGQDPYHNPGEAMGLCFSIPKGIRIPPSLKNIYKEMQNDISFIPPNHGDLTSWATEGVLLLNAMLTVRQNEPGSHRKLGWQEFTNAVIKTISSKREGVVFLLWGNFAKNKKELINSNKHLILESAHPSPLARNAFFDNHHFSKTNAFLTQSNRSPINWQIQLYEP